MLLKENKAGSAPVRLIVGLGNPRSEYGDTRHNAGAWLLDAIARHCQLSFRSESKFKGESASLVVERTDDKLYLFIPSTYMNHSGQAVGLISNFYKILPENILIAHDDLDLPIGETRLKFGGGHGGHNGLRDVIAKLGTPDFYRCRIGIAHPGVREVVSDYVLSKPSSEDRQKIEESAERVIDVLDYLLIGQFEKAMQFLHTKDKAG